MEDLVCFAVVACLVWTFLHSRGADKRWRFVTILAVLSLVLGAIWYTYWEVAHGSALASHVTASAYVFLPVSLVLSLASLLSFPTDPLDAAEGRLGEGRAGHRWYVIITLDSLVLVGSVFLVVWTTSLAQLLRRQHYATPAVVSVVGANVGFLILLTVIALMAMFRRPRSGAALALLGAGVGALALFTAVVLSLAVQGFTRLPVLCGLIPVGGWLLILLACLVPMPESAKGSGRNGPLFLWLQAAVPYLALTVAGALAIGRLIDYGAIGQIETYGLLGLLLLVLVRQMTMLSENTRLLILLRSSREELRYQAFHDPLTGLANRTLFADRLEHALTFRDGRPFGLVFCDLDDFKQVNDRLGHAAGDELLRVTANRLRIATRAEDTVARIGGDEFALLLTGVHDAPEAACRRLAETIRAPAVLAGRPQPVGASLGLVIAEPGGRRKGAEALLREADLAMYEAKRRGKDRTVVYRQGTPRRSRNRKGTLDLTGYEGKAAARALLRHVPRTR